MEGAQREVFAAAQRAQHNLSALMDQMAAKQQARYLSTSVVVVLPKHKVHTYVEYRAVSGVFHNIDPPPPSPPSVCVLPPHQRRGGTHSPGGEGGGGSIFWKTHDIHCKKELAIFPSPAGMSLTKLSLAGKKLNYSRPGRV